MDWIDQEPARPFVKAAAVDSSQQVKFRDYERADRATRQIIEAIQTCETPDDLSDYVLAETSLIDGIAAYSPDMHAAIVAAAEEHRAHLKHGAAAMRRATARTSEPAGSGHKTERKPMANNPDFKQIVQKDVEFLWPRLDQTYRYNAHKKTSEPADPGMQGAAWSLAWKLDKDAASALYKELRAHYEDCRTRNPKLPAFGTVFGMKPLTDENGNKTGEVKFSAKRNGMTSGGKPNKPPRVVGRDLLELADKAIWTGSLGHVRAIAFPTTDADGQGGISLLLDAVQVREASYGSDNLEDAFGPAETNFGDDIQRETERQSQQTRELVDDDLPF